MPDQTLATNVCLPVTQPKQESLNFQLRRSIEGVGLGAVSQAEQRLQGKGRDWGAVRLSRGCGRSEMLTWWVWLCLLFCLLKRSPYVSQSWTQTYKTQTPECWNFSYGLGNLARFRIIVETGRNVGSTIPFVPTINVGSTIPFAGVGVGIQDRRKVSTSIPLRGLSVTATSRAHYPDKVSLWMASNPQSSAYLGSRMLGGAEGVCHLWLPLGGADSVCPGGCLLSFSLRHFG